jgi:hypothetical protein
VPIRSGLGQEEQQFADGFNDMVQHLQNARNATREEVKNVYYAGQNDFIVAPEGAAGYFPSNAPPPFNADSSLVYMSEQQNHAPVDHKSGNSPHVMEHIRILPANTPQQQQPPPPAFQAEAPHVVQNAPPKYL